MSAQDTANEIGAKLREIEALAADLDDADLTDALAELHELLGEAFCVLRDETDLGLDWDEITDAGGESAKAAHTDGGTGKTPPR